MKNQSFSISAVVTLFFLIFFAYIFILGLGASMVPLLISFIFAYLSFPFIEKAEAYRIHRSVAIVGVFLFISIFWIGVLFLLAPTLIKDFKSFTDEIPNAISNLIVRVDSIVNELGLQVELDPQFLVQLVKETGSKYSSQIISSSSQILQKLFSGAAGGFVFILNLLLIPVFYFHLIHRYETILSTIELNIPPYWRPKLKKYTTLLNDILSGYFRGQVLVCLILATLYGIGFWISGVKFGLIIGFISGCLSIIPFVGSLFGLFTALAMCAYQGFELIQVIGTLFVFIIVQTLEGFFITPKLVGNKVGLDLLTTMLALIIGGNLLGIAGMILAIPLAALIKHIIQDVSKNYRESRFYQNP